MATTRWVAQPQAPIWLTRESRSVSLSGAAGIRCRVEKNSSRKGADVTGGTTSTHEERARKHAEAYSALMWHVGAFIVINAFFWVLDLVDGPAGLQWAHWITILWGVPLGFHLVAYLVGGAKERKYRELLAED